MKNGFLFGMAMMGMASLPITANAQIAVFDPTQAVNMIQQLSSMAEQLANLKSQLTQLEQTSSALNGITSLGSLVSDGTSTLKSNMPSEWKNVYNDAMSSSSTISSSAESMIDKFKSKIEGMDTDDALDYVNKQIQQKGAYDRITAQTIYDNQMKELNTIQSLTDQISSTSTVKEIADLQARIQTAQGAIQAETSKLQVISMLQESQDKLLEAQKQMALQKSLVGDGNYSLDLGL